MFWFLHRACLVAFWCFWAVVAFYIYQQRELLRPGWDAVELMWRKDRSAPSELPVLAGSATKAYAGNGFELREGSGIKWNVGLAGVDVSRASPGSRERENASAIEARTNLVRLVVGRPVRVLTTIQNRQAGTALGLVFIGETNVNREMLAAGLGHLKREEIRVLPWRDQMGLALAEWQARRMHVGVWEQAGHSLQGSEVALER